MKADELAKELLKHPDFDVVFSFSEEDKSEWGMTVRRFQNVKIDDIGHSAKVVSLGGDEK